LGGGWGGGGGVERGWPRKKVWLDLASRKQSVGKKNKRKNMFWKKYKIARNGEGNRTKRIHGDMSGKRKKKRRLSLNM